MRGGEGNARWTLIVDRMDRPVIGICTAWERARWSVWDDAAALRPRNYVDAVRRDAAPAPARGVRAPRAPAHPGHVRRRRPRRPPRRGVARGALRRRAPARDQVPPPPGRGPDRRGARGDRLGRDGRPARGDGGAGPALRARRPVAPRGGRGQPADRLARRSGRGPPPPAPRPADPLADPAAPPPPATGDYP